MALEDILGAIRSETERAVAMLLEEAESEARQILQLAVAEAEREEARLAATVDDRIRQERGRLLSRGHLEAANERRSAREEVYQTALDQVSGRLAEVRNSPRYRDVFERLLDATLAILPAPAAIHVDMGDAEVMKGLLKARSIDASLETEDLPLGGLVAVSAGRSLDNTLASRLVRADPELRLVAGEAIPALRGGAG